MNVFDEGILLIEVVTHRIAFSFKLTFFNTKLTYLNNEIHEVDNFLVLLR